MGGRREGWWPGCRHPVTVQTVRGGVLGNEHQGGSVWSRAGSACGQEVVNQDQMTWALGGHTKNFILRDQERDGGAGNVCNEMCFRKSRDQTGGERGDQSRSCCRQASLQGESGRIWGERTQTLMSEP